ncbi:MBL fold metallo-hydrolase [Chloroflexota bacterium]
MNIRFLGAHNSESQTTSCACILIDDKLVLDAGGLTSNLSVARQQKIKAILITHKHYDHIRDIPIIALNLYQKNTTLNLYTTADAQNAIETHLLNGKLYPKFQELPEAKPTVRFNLIDPYETQRIADYEILALPMRHNGTTISYQVSDTQGKTIFYTADTGPGLAGCWKYASPQVLIIDVTVPNNDHEFAINTGHLTPNLLHEELAIFQRQKGYLPRIITVHMDATREQEIKNEITVVAKALNTSITTAHEGMELDI